MRRSRGGQELLAHELTHVVQQNGGQCSDRCRKMRNLIKTYWD
ncbi:eCIS core domain-containing protein [Nostoc sp.]